MTRKEEKAVLKSFQGLYKDFPSGTIEYFDSPDFIITNAAGFKIGIELTQIVHSEVAKQDSSSKNQFTDHVLSELVSLLPFHFSLSIHLYPGKGIAKSKRTKVAKETAAFCSREFHSLQNHEYSRVEDIELDLETLPAHIKGRLLVQGLRNLPPGVKVISIVRCDEHGSSFNSMSEAAVIPNFSKDKLLERLVIKEAKIESYKPCDEYWLLLWQGGGITGYFKEIEFELPIPSKFDRVFLVKEFENELIILKP